MIERITGFVALRNENHIVVDVGGVGYGVDTTVGTANQLVQNSQVSLWIYTHVRDDDIKLFGFSTIEEKILFTHLLSAPGVGAKLAMAMLSILGARGIVVCILSDESERLKEVPGIAAKAKEIQLHLKRRLSKLEDNAWLNRLKISSEPQVGASLNFAPESDIDSSKQISPQLVTDLQSALSNLGYREREVQNAIKILSNHDTQEVSFEALLRQAIGLLSAPDKRSQISTSNVAKRQALIDEVF